MPRWIPEAVWKGEDVFIIGGGPSLKTFDWELLRPENTIGCNDAYKHGVDICSVCLFGDHAWFKEHLKKGLLDYKGIVFTSSPYLQRSDYDWLWILTRHSRGLHLNALGWNKNTGAEAVNLALILGAKRIFLLGFDMHLGEDGESNWHNNNLDKPKEVVYKTFLKEFGRVAAALSRDFPEIEVFNITSDSALNDFQKVEPELFWKERSKKHEVPV